MIRIDYQFKLIFSRRKFSEPKIKKIINISYISCFKVIFDRTKVFEGAILLSSAINLYKKGGE